MGQACRKCFGLTKKKPSTSSDLKDQTKSQSKNSALITNSNAQTTKNDDTNLLRKQHSEQKQPPLKCPQSNSVTSVQPQNIDKLNETKQIEYDKMESMPKIESNQEHKKIESIILESKNNVFNNKTDPFKEIPTIPDIKKTSSDGNYFNQNELFSKKNFEESTNNTVSQIKYSNHFNSRNQLHKANDQICQFSSNQNYRVLPTTYFHIQSQPPKIMYNSYLTADQGMNLTQSVNRYNSQSTGLYSNYQHHPSPSHFNLQNKYRVRHDNFYPPSSYGNDLRQSSTYENDSNKSSPHQNDSNQSSIYENDSNKSSVHENDSSQSSSHQNDSNQSSGYENDQNKSSVHQNDSSQSSSHQNDSELSAVQNITLPTYNLPEIIFSDMTMSQIPGICYFQVALAIFKLIGTYYPRFRQTLQLNDEFSRCLAQYMQFCTTSMRNTINKFKILYPSEMKKMNSTDIIQFLSRKYFCQNDKMQSSLICSVFLPELEQWDGEEIENHLQDELKSGSISLSPFIYVDAKNYVLDHVNIFEEDYFLIGLIHFKAGHFCCYIKWNECFYKIDNNSLNEFSEDEIQQEKYFVGSLYFSKITA